MSGVATQPRKSASGRRGDHEEEGANVPAEHDSEAKQELLPPLRWLLQPDADRFAHPAEIEFARLLTFYGVRWAYEPTTFALGWGVDGRPQEFVTPDFYLPDHGLYVELTTMRQRLVTRKNRKFRLLRERYPNIRVRMLYLRDYERLQNAYGPSESEREARLVSPLIAEPDVEERIGELARQLVAAWGDSLRDEARQRPLLLGIGSGSNRFLASLSERVRQLAVPVDVDRVELTAFAEEHGVPRVRVSRPPTAPVMGRFVIIVQEVLSTGFSAAFLETWLRRHGACDVGICALLDREAARIIDVPVVCRGFAAPDVALAGYGLRRWQQFRDLPFIAEIATD
jgi:hypoxanthine phosphoribosyltransferase